MKLICTFVILLLHISLAIASANNDSVRGLFSTFHVSSKSNDISGAEIHIVPNPVGFSAIVQASEGAPGFPEVIELSVTENKIEFTIAESSGSGFAPGRYLGLVTEKGLKLNGPKGLYEDYFLPRKSSFWQ